MSFCQIFTRQFYIEYMKRTPKLSCACYFTVSRLNCWHKNARTLKIFWKVAWFFVDLHRINQFSLNFRERWVPSIPEPPKSFHPDIPFVSKEFGNKVKINPFQANFFSHGTSPKSFLDFNRHYLNSQWPYPTVGKVFSLRSRLQKNKKRKSITITTDMWQNAGEVVSQDSQGRN